ncbi:hypothetical protein GCM10007415_31320 [Parapedobacter pyrenivorans]|uniref:Uncharacterized protein n=1 Tax=Parapedobacter pyrenivorans TaxID=1305674 RepID=A0A917MC55_9SPHI|nr:helix-turn-helix domain-containing protein [Parapedobacter pyrenivorans]GGG94017.1 hypothetical protein GCM10007415_31320 [Parapedobacter pyrenivorans]
MLKQLERCEAYLASIDRKLAFIAERFPLEKLDQVFDMVCQHPPVACNTPEPDPLYDASYAADRIGVVDRTLYRLTGKGKLPIDSYGDKGTRLFRHSDIERCRRYYLGLQP